MSREDYLVGEREKMRKDFNDAINFAIDKAGAEAVPFLELWREGCWDEIDAEFPDFSTASVRMAT